MKIDVKRINWRVVWRGFVKSNYITALWNWFMGLAGKASEPVLFVSVLYSGYQLVPGVAQPSADINAIAFVIQQAALDVGGMGLIKLTKDEAPEKFKFARGIGIALISLMVVNMIVATAGRVFPVPAQAMQIVEGILLIIRSVMAVLFGHAIHTLKDDKDEDHTAEIEALKQRLEEAQKPVTPTWIPMAKPALAPTVNDGNTDGKITATPTVKTSQKSPSNPRKSVSVKEASVMLNLSESYVRDLRQKGMLKRSSANKNLLLISSILEYQQTRQRPVTPTVKSPTNGHTRITQPLAFVPLEV